MKLINQIKLIIITIISVLCAILMFNLLRKLRSVLPWRVNCWFCNQNIWIKLSEYNCWTCPKCEQYNGFTRDGDYNKQIIHTSNDQTINTPKMYKRSPPKNGLCKMCNINQELKVSQLANFVPMNDRSYDNEIESYRLQLEKAYKLCSPCKKVIQIKLYKEKETLLGSKLINSRTPEMKCHIKQTQNETIKFAMNYLYIIIAIALFILSVIDLIKLLRVDSNWSSSILNLKETGRCLLERIVSIIQIKTSVTWPSIIGYFNDISTYINYDLYWSKFPMNISSINIDEINDLMQEVLAGLACFIQIGRQMLTGNKLKNAIITELVLTLFVIICMAKHTLTATPLSLSFIKFFCASTNLIIHLSFNIRTNTTSAVKVNYTPKNMKSLIQSSSMIIDDEDTSALDTDDDVSLSKFGLHNITDSSNETSPLNKTGNSGRKFMPRTHDSLWSKPQLNSTFCVNSLIAKSPSSVPDTVFVKPSFNKYRKFIRDDSDSDLDESIGSLYIGSPQKTNHKKNSVFSLRKFTATPSFVAPSLTSLRSGRPLISPSVLSHNTSWVAGGYWGQEGERQLFKANGSRSSSQSSGFESQASRQPPSRDESDCGEQDKANLLLDRFQNCTMSGYNVPQTFSRVSSPIYPQMMYNGHVHIPQPRFAPQPSHLFGFGQPQQNYVQNSMFKSSCGSGLIKLPQLSSFSSH